MSTVKGVVLAVLVGLITIFILQNAGVVSLRFLFWRTAMSQAIFVPVVFAVGFIAGALVIIFSGKEKS
ncbi:MAG: LapA family protein [Candidatus Omnitrophica bacterium]|nr:LapA family protein [Candidatus Omnitrophota bacterium]